MAAHRIYIETESGATLAPGPLTVTGEEAQHAIRVKRLIAGESVEILDGRGHIARAVIAGTDKTREGWQLSVTITDIEPVPALLPRIEVFCPPPKGPRLSEMIDGLSQTGAAAWSPLNTVLTQHEPRDTRLDRTRRIAAESSKQCGRAWLLDIGPAKSFRQAIAKPASASLILADAAGEPYTATGASLIHLLLGPEGGWRDDELQAARAAGARLTRFGPHTMRIETAAVAASAIILDHETRAQQ